MTRESMERAVFHADRADRLLVEIDALRNPEVERSRTGTVQPAKSPARAETIAALAHVANVHAALASFWIAVDMNQPPTSSWDIEP